MVSLDEAEICEIIRIYLLERLSPFLGKENFGLCIEDGLAAVNAVVTLLRHEHNNFQKLMFTQTRQ